MRKGRKCVRGDRRESDVIRYFRAEIFFRAPIKIFRNFSLWNFPSFVKVAEIEIIISYDTFLRCNDDGGIQNKENRERERGGESLLRANTFIIHYTVYIKLFVYSSSCLINSCT